ncbi:MAG: hypothetical protein ACW97X_01110 [Candidatus Hodarchaeales archaeon]|jgi:hypothetical protein
MEMDYHGLRLFEARNKICDDLIEAFEIGEPELDLIHGFKHGNSIKSYIWGIDGLCMDLNHIRPDIKIRIQKGRSRSITKIKFMSK